MSEILAKHPANADLPSPKRTRQARLLDDKIVATLEEHMSGWIEQLKIVAREYTKDDPTEFETCKRMLEVLADMIDTEGDMARQIHAIKL